MNIKRLIVTCIVVFVVIFGFEWLLHGVILKTDYVVTGFLWRPVDEMDRFFPWLVVGQFVVAAAFTVSYASVAKEGCGIGCGLAAGLLAGLLLSGPHLITYAVQPIPGKLIAAWTIGRLIEMAVSGGIAAALYRPAQTQHAVAERAVAG
jgi:hypothetical protein